MKLLARIRQTVLVAAAGLAVLLVASALPGSPRVVHAATNCDVADLSLDAEEQAFIGLINNYRAQNNAGPVTGSPTLNRASSWMAVDMATKNYLSHTDALGRDPFVRMDQCDVATGFAKAENVAAGYTTAAEVFEGWRISPGHNANMLNPGYKTIGIARSYNAGSTYGWYWASNFSSETVQAAPPQNASCGNPGIDVLPRSNTGTAGTTFVVTVTAACNSPAFQFWVGKAPAQNTDLFDPSVQWSVLQSYSGAGSASWTPAVAGFYYVRVWVKNGLNSIPANALYDTAIGLNQMVINPPAGNAPCSAPGIDVNPRTNFGNVGTRFTVSVSAVCATPVYQFWVGKAPSANTDVFDPSVQWQVFQPYGGANTAPWTPGAPGYYHVRIWVKNGVGSVPANGVFDTAIGLNIMTINP
jgi:uncharacterized protein YkwD